MHGGGIDLVFPHHENEIAQSCCAFGSQRMANIWMHNGFLQVEGRKMSKSEGNFVTIDELLNTEKFGGRKWPGEVLRLAMLMTHYRQPIDFSVSRLEEAFGTINRWADIKMAVNERYDADIASWNARILSVSPILDDLNVVPIISELHQTGSAALKGSEQAAKNFTVALSLLGFSGLEYFSRDVANLAVPLGMTSEQRAHMEDNIQRRLELIRNKDWAEADRIRDTLLAQGIQLKDGKDPATGERITTWEVRR